MAKKSFGKFLAFATVSGAVAAGISYFLKYKSFNKELDKDFHDFEGDKEDDFDGSLPHESEDPKRNYVTLGEKKTPVSDTTDTADETSDRVDKTPDTVDETVKEPSAQAEDAADGTWEDAAETTVIEDDNSIL